ncbi:queuine tRNA-ribosyltransferase [Hamiltosporidium magnivora]|uniref:Queuine tRNA-ribosyltransferase n=1 Tax=Hamiltosporidium magnivora TaxID=148818 RepID=A0A4Q9L044_9MICR|nr:queuine tRNA-ribosyltransferase [Hamiltosporidium magnivora]
MKKIGKFLIKKNCVTSNARTSTLQLSHGTLNLPKFMPVATYGCMKGVLHSQLHNTIILSNTYHLRNLNRNLHQFTRYNHNILTDSGGFQIVSLNDNIISEEGVTFHEKYKGKVTDKNNTESEKLNEDKELNKDVRDKGSKEDKNNTESEKLNEDKEVNKDVNGKGTKKDKNNTESDKYSKDTEESKDINGEDYLKIQQCVKSNISNTNNNTPLYSTLLTPEISIQIQNKLNSDIMMQLDDVRNPLSTYNDIECAMYRSLRWLDRCILEHKNTHQLLFPIIQGGLFKDLRIISTTEIKKRLLFYNEEEFCKMGVNDSTNEQQGLNNNTDMQQGLNDSTNEQQGLNDSSNKQQGLNDSTNKQQGVSNNTPTTTINTPKVNMCRGVAIGGLSGGEDKNHFCDVISLCVSILGPNIPKYVMGVGYPEDVLVCICLGIDMMDCVYPTRTARFGIALTDKGCIKVNTVEWNTSDRCVGTDISNISSPITNTSISNPTSIAPTYSPIYPLDPTCKCYCCLNYNIQYLKTLKNTTNLCILLTLHNLFYMENFIDRIRISIENNRLNIFVKEYVKNRYNNQPPEWFVRAMKSVNLM